MGSRQLDVSGAKSTGSISFSRPLAPANLFCNQECLTCFRNIFAFTPLHILVHLFPTSAKGNIVLKHQAQRNILS